MNAENEILLRPDPSGVVSQIRGLVGGQMSGLEALLDAGIFMYGIDERRPWRSWGEAYTYLIFIVVSGTLFYPRPNDRPWCIGPQECLLLPEPASKRVETHREGTNIIWILLTRPSAMQTSLSLPAEPTVRHFDSTNILFASTEALIREVARLDLDAQEARAHLCQVILHYLHRELNTRELPSHRAFRATFSHLLENVHTHPGQDWTSARLAAQAGLSKVHFHRIVKALYGMPPAAIIRKIRMEKATALLQSTNLKLDAIAAAVGFSNAYAFSQAFLKYSGQRPGAWRQTVAE